MKRNEWHTERESEDNIEINDGTLRYYTRRGKYDGYGLREAAKDFARTYDHNDVPGVVECIATNLHTGRSLAFSFKEMD